MPGLSTQPERALAAIDGFAGARPGPLLADGPASTSWQVEHGGARWVLRLDKPVAAVLGLDRENERLVAAAVAGAGLTPAYRHFDAAAGIALRRFVEGRPWTPHDLRDPARLSALAAALRALHRLPPAGSRFDPVGAAQRYATQLGTAEASRIAQRAVAAREAVPPGGQAPVLCHNDLVSDNILERPGGGVLLIDWEYAGLGDGLFDLAVVLQHHGLGEDHADLLLEAYLQAKPDPLERERLGAWRRLYALLLELWVLRTTG